MNEREKLKIWRKLDELARENPELYQKIILGHNIGVVAPMKKNIDATASMLEKKERCRCDL